MLSWLEEDLLGVGDTTFRVLREAEAPRVRGADFLVAKPRWLLESYLQLFAELQPENVIELGVYRGGSTALLLELARPHRLVGIDRMPARSQTAVREYAARRGLDGTLRTYAGVDQGDRTTLREIAQREFGDQPLDLVIDDCSHRYEETKASFCELFPLLRPGGVFVIEDWPWAHSPVESEHPQGMYPGQEPLTRLIFELVLAIPGLPGAIVSIEINLGVATVRRGERGLDPRTFDVGACSHPRGRALLAPAGSDSDP